MSLSLKSFDFTATIIFTPPPIRERSIVMTVSLCIWKYTSDLFHFLYMLPMAVTRSSSDNVAICYLLPVLWMTSFPTSWRATTKLVGYFEHFGLCIMYMTAKKSTGIQKVTQLRETVHHSSKRFDCFRNRAKLFLKFPENPSITFRQIFTK